MSTKLKSKLLKPDFMKKIYKFYIYIKNKVMYDEMS